MNLSTGWMACFGLPACLILNACVTEFVERLALLKAWEQKWGERGRLPPPISNLRSGYSHPPKRSQETLTTKTATSCHWGLSNQHLTVRFMQVRVRNQSSVLQTPVDISQAFPRAFPMGSTPVPWQISSWVERVNLSSRQMPHSVECFLEAPSAGLR